MQRCPHCSETLEGLVPICWHCGRAVDTQAVPPERPSTAPAAVPDAAHEPNLFDQLWFEDDAAAVMSQQAAAHDADLETWSTLEAPPAPQPSAIAPPSVAYTPPPASVESQATFNGYDEPLAAASPELMSALGSLAAALDKPDPAPAAAEPAPAKQPAPVPAARPRWQLPAVGLAGVGTIAVVLSLMGRPASDAVPAAAPATASNAAAAPPAATAPAAATAPTTQGPITAPAAPASAPPAATPSTASAVEIEEAPAWIVPRRTNWGPDGARTLTLQLEALDDVRAGREQVRPVLAVRCLSRRTDVFVAIGTSASIEGGDTHTVTVQFDDEAPVKQQWPGSASYQELFAPDGLAVARRLSQTRMLRFTFTPFRARPVTAAFNVAGFDRHVKDVARICGWSGQDAATARRR